MGCGDAARTGRTGGTTAPPMPRGGAVDRGTPGRDTLDRGVVGRAHLESGLERDSYRRARLAVLGVSLVVCLLAYTHRIPLVCGELASCAIPLLWAIDAYRAEKRLMFAVAATLLLITALPLLQLLQTLHSAR